MWHRPAAEFAYVRRQRAGESNHGARAGPGIANVKANLHAGEMGVAPVVSTIAYRGDSPRCRSAFCARCSSLARPATLTLLQTGYLKRCIILIDSGRDATGRRRHYRIAVCSLAWLSLNGAAHGRDVCVPLKRRRRALLPGGALPAQSTENRTLSR